MNRLLYCCAVAVIIYFSSCKKSADTSTDVKSNFVGNWSGSLIVTGTSTPLKFSMAINADNTVLNIDSAFGNAAFPGTYAYTIDSLKISYNNGTRWNMKFAANYTACAGTFLGYAGATGTVSMTKK